MIRINSSRRSFLKASAAASALSLAPRFLLEAADASAQSRGENILVVVQLSGGNDGLNTLVPYADDVYHRSRPLLGIPANQVHKIDDYAGLHPAMGGFARLLERGQLGIIQGVGYPTPDRSHFSSMDIWHTAQREAAEGPRSSGWLGRYLDRNTPATGAQDVPALHLASGAPRLPLALVGRDIHAGSFQSIEAFKLNDGGNAQWRHAVAGAVASERDSSNSLLSFLQHSAVSALDSSQKVQEAVRRYKTDVKYPETSLAQRLRTVAQLIDAGLSTRIYYLDLDGFDTHANQAASHASLLGELSGAVAAFVDDLSQHGHGERVLTMTFSEFGRRVHENASQGTDHGAAAPMFIAGARVKHGLLGRRPSLSDLDQGDLKFTVDFRQVYAGILDQWLNVDSAATLGQKFPPLAVI